MFTIVEGELLFYFISKRQILIECEKGIQQPREPQWCNKFSCFSDRKKIKTFPTWWDLSNSYIRNSTHFIFLYLFSSSFSVSHYVSLTFFLSISFWVNSLHFECAEGIIGVGLLECIKNGRGGRGCQMWTEMNTTHEILPQTASL